MKGFIFLSVFLVVILLVGCEVPEKVVEEVEEEAEEREAVVEPIEQEKPVKITYEKEEKIKEPVPEPEVEEEVAGPVVEGAIEIWDKGFSEMELTVKKGEVVTWINKHSLEKNVVLTFQNEDTRQLSASDQIKYGETYERSFEEAGTYLFWTVSGGVEGTLIVE